MTAHKAVVAGLLAAAILVPCARAGEPWDQPFAGDLRAVMEGAKRVNVPEGQPLVMLLEDHQYSIDSQGRTASTLRRVYRVVSADAVEDWASVEQYYQPWYQQKPQIRGRVISSDGVAHWLDPKTIAESPALELDSNIFSDRRVARAPLPAVGPGAVVEYEVSIADRLPLLDAGVVQRISVTDTIPLERFHVVIEADKAVALRTATRLIPESALKRERTRTGTRLECELGRQPVRKEFEFNLPSDTPASPYLSFATGRSWREVAASYASIVDRQIGPGDVNAALAGIDTHQAPAALVAQLVAKLHRQVRYTGVEFGEAAIVPASPADTLKRGYGDCKDKSTLLVAWLRAAGMKAYLALLASGFGTDVDSDLPGLGMFDHAIVYVAADPPLWVDATAADVRVGVLPTGDQGRLALIAKADTTALVKTPESESADNWERHKIEVRLSEYGPGQVMESVEAAGTREARLRASCSSDPSRNKEWLEGYVKQNYAGKLGKFEVTQKDDWSGPFRLSVQALQSARVNTGMEDAGVALLPHLLFADLPFSLLGGDETNEDGQKRERDFVFWEPYRVEHRYRILAPPLFKAATLPESAELKLGTVKYARRFTIAPDGAVEAVYLLDTGKRRLTPAEFAAVRAGLRQHAKSTPDLIGLVPATAEYMAMGQTGKALALVRDHVRQHPGEATAHVRFSRMLVAAGIRGAAVSEAAKAVELAPKSGQAWQAVGWAHQHDAFGRRFMNGWNPQEAEKCYRKALELDADDRIAAVDLAILLEHTRNGVRYGSGARLGDAITLYREVFKKGSLPDLEPNLAYDLLYSGQVDAAAEQLKKCSREIQARLTPAITALKDGAAKAIVSMQATFPDPAARQVQLLGTALILIHMRRYDLARPIMGAAVRLQSAPISDSVLDMADKFKRYEETLLPESDPSSTVQRLLIELFLNDPEPERQNPLFASAATAADRKAVVEPLRSILAMVRRGYPRSWFSDDSIVDMTLSSAEFEKAGDDARGYRVKATIPHAVAFPAIYVVREGERYRILASNSSLRPVGQIVLDLLEKKDIKGAQWWLDCIVPDLTAGEDGTGFPAIRSLWSGITPATRGPGAIRTAAASLIGRYSGSSPALQILRQARLRASTGLERAQIDKAICETLNKAGQWHELRVAAGRLAASKAFSEEGFRYGLKAASGAGNWAELQALAQQRLQVNPQNDAAARAVVSARVFRSDRAGAAEPARKVTVLPFAGDAESTSAAWIAMLDGKADQKLLTKLKEGHASGGDRNYYYTVAMLQTVLQMPEDAQQSLMKALDQDYSGEVDARAWVIYGRVCQQYGFPSEAAAAYDRARSARRDEEGAEWALALIPH